VKRLHHRFGLRRALAAFCLGAFACGVVPAQAPATTTPAQQDLAAFEARFRALNPRTRIDSVGRSPVPGLYEVVMGKTLAYVEPTGRYALFGHVFDMQTLSDLTADRRAQLDRVDLGQLPTSHALKHVLGKGTRALHVFADPMCGHCRSLETALQGLQDVTVHTYPVAVLGPASEALVRAIGCAPDPQAAWTAWMHEGTAPADPAPGCQADPTVAQAAQALGINATPTVIAGDGRKTAGAMTTQQLQAWIDGNAQQARTPTPR
jgi:thiol:disulfide interchange protein DsbC